MSVRGAFHSNVKSIPNSCNSGGDPRLFASDRPSNNMLYTHTSAEHLPFRLSTQHVAVGRLGKIYSALELCSYGLAALIFRIRDTQSAYLHTV